MSASPTLVAGHLLERAEWSYSRASGPGGQHRDHAETRAELTVRREHLDGLPLRVAERVAGGLQLDVRPLRLRAGTERSRERNRGLVERRLLERLREVLAPPRPARRPTRPSRAAVARRREGKALRAAVKAGRRTPDGDH